MAAVLFFLPYQVATHPSNFTILPGAKLKFYLTGTSTPVNVWTTSALSVSAGSTITADGGGRFDPFYLNNAVAYRLIIQDKDGTELEDIDPFIPGTVPAAGALSPYSDAAAASAAASATSAAASAASAVVADASADMALAAVAEIDVTVSDLPVPSRAILAIAATTIPVYLSEAGREGVFVFDSSNLSAQVTADPRQAIYVAPESDTSGASGAWVRRVQGAFDAGWYGALGDGSTDDHSALQAWLDHGGSLYLPAHEYYSSDNLILRKSAAIEGAGYGFDARTSGYDNMPGSRIRFAAGKGFTIQGQATATDVATVAADTATYFVQEGASGATIRNLALIGANTGTSVTGCYIRTLCHLENVRTIQFKGKGFDLSASSDISDGNSEYGDLSKSSLINCGAKENGSHGLHIRGRDANTCLIDNFDAQLNAGWGILDESISGNDYGKPHLATNTLGAMKAIGSVSFSTLGAPYIEPGAGSNTEIGGNNVVIGNDITGVNTPPDQPPAQIAGTTSSVNKLRFTWTWNAAAISGYGLVFHNNTSGLNLQGEGSAADLTLVNKAGNATAANTTATKDWSFKGHLSLDGATNPELTVNGSAYGQVLFKISGTTQAQILGDTATLYASADTVIVRDYTTRLDNRLTIDSAGARFNNKLTTSHATAGLGYATGAGGAVTQATNRTTGVTLDKVCGAITLVSAAGSASWQTFTVTNSAVAATDVIRVSQKSGTDLYMIHVTNVAAGSFKISFATTGGTTTEQPVFNYAVIKAVAA